MKKLSYNKIVIGVVVFLTLVTALLLLLNTLSRPHIRYIDVDGGTNTAEFLDSKIKIYFSTPIERSEGNKPVDFKKYISIEPAIDYNLTWGGNTLYIIPKDTLVEDTSYKIKVAQGFKDVYGNAVEKSFEYSFKTKPLEITYLEKNYPKSKDRIISRNVKNASFEVLFEDDNIKQYSVNKDFVVIITTRQDKTDNIKTFDLRTRAKRDLGLTKASIPIMDLSHAVDSFLFIYQEVEPKGQLLQPLSNSTIKIYDLNSQTVSDFNPGGTAKDVMDANFSPDGRSILYRSAESFYYLAPLDLSSDPIAIGRFIGTGGFNKDGTKIVFTNYDPLQTYSSFPFIVVFTSDRKTVQITDGSTYIVDPVFASKSDNIIFGNRYQDLLGAQGIFNTSEGVTDSTSNYTFKKIFDQTDESLELPKPSWDDRYIVAERYNKNALLDYQNQRSFVNQRKPYKADLVIYDTVDGKIITEIPNAIDAEWER
ncbi:MAG: Ig-like domain-containing protein [Candidatus Dojkabacteria bacterium]